MLNDELRKKIAELKAREQSVKIGTEWKAVVTDKDIDEVFGISGTDEEVELQALCENCPFVECPLHAEKCGSEECEKLLRMVRKTEEGKNIEISNARIMGAKYFLDDLMAVLKFVPGEDYYIIDPEELAKVAWQNRIRMVGRDGKYYDGTQTDDVNN